MIDPKRLEKAHFALRAISTMELSDQEWRDVHALMAALTIAIHRGDDAACRVAIAELFLVGTTRGEPLDQPGEQNDAPRERDTNFDGHGGGGDWGGGAPQEYGWDAKGLDEVGGGAGGAEQTGHTERGAADLRPATGAPPPDLADALIRTTALLADTAAHFARVPHLDVDTDGPVRPGQTFTVTAYLNDSAPEGPDVEAQPLSYGEVPPAVSELEVGVWLNASAHFVIDTAPIQSISLLRGQSSSTSAQFQVTVNADVAVETDDPPALQALFTYRQRASGSVRRVLPIATDPASVALVISDPLSASARFDPGARPADLCITVMRVRGTATTYAVKASTDLLGGQSVSGQWDLSADSAAYVRRLMSAFGDDDATARARTDSLRGAGVAFFADTPAEFRDLYWRLVDAGTAPRTISVNSEEASVPWELMIPERRLPDRSWQTLEPLGVQCAIGRWHDPEAFAPSQTIPLTDSLVLAPKYNPVLPKAATEQRLVLDTFPGKEVPATYDELQAFYADNSASLLHFVCHGSDDTLQAIALQRQQFLFAQQLRGSGLSKSCRASRPLVFLNACELGRPGVGLVIANGFPMSFIASDAAGVIAPLWQVEDTVAHEVAVTFYQEVKRQPTTPFAQILQHLRARAYAPDGQDSFAAYCYYGDPFAAAERAI